MLLSTSSSKELIPPPARLAKGSITVLLLLIGLLLVVLEVFTRVVVEHASKIQREVNQEYAEAAAIRRSTAPGQPKQLLIVGNSLVGHDLDFAVLQHSLAPSWQTHEFWIYATNYEDWYFGLKRLFAQGAKPDVVAITLAAMHWETSGIRGDYGSLYLFRAVDIPKIGLAADLDRTRTSNLLFARFSKFYALRSEVRKQAFQFLIPDLPAMYRLFRPTASHHLSARRVAAIVDPRLRTMQQLVAEHGASLILIVPPVPRRGEEFQAELRMAAQQAGVRAVIMPLTCDDLPAAAFADDVHLSPLGAQVFTSRVAGLLKEALER